MVDGLVGLGALDNRMLGIIPYFGSSGSDGKLAKPIASMAA